MILYLCDRFYASQIVKVWSLLSVGSMTLKCGTLYLWIQRY